MSATTTNLIQLWFPVRCEVSIASHRHSLIRKVDKT